MDNTKARVPHDADSELGLIGAASQGLYDDIAAAGLSEDHFFTTRCREMWKMMVGMEKIGTKINHGTLLHGVRDSTTVSAQDIIDADTHCHSAQNWPYFADILDEKRKARLVQQVGAKLTNVASCGVTVDQLVSEAESEIFSLNTAIATGKDGRKESFQRLVDILEEAHGGKQVGVATGYRPLDRILGGLRGGQLITLAARPAVGKSALAGNIAERLAMEGTPVAFFSFEMTQDELNLRMLCSYSDANLIGDVLNQQATERERLNVIAKAGSKVADLMKAPLKIIDDGSLTVAQIRSHARRLVRDHGVKLIIVDYIQLVPPSPDDRKAQRYVQVGSITGGLKQMAMELNVPVIGLAQVSRESDKESRRPRLSDLRESGSIEQDSDVVLFLYIQDPRLSDGPKMLLKLFVAKNRAGRTGEIDLVFIRNKIRFEDANNPDHEEWIGRVQEEVGVSK